MAAKIVLFISASAVLAQVAFGQAISVGGAPAFGSFGLNAGAGAPFGREVEIGLGYGNLGNPNLGLGLGGAGIGLGSAGVGLGSAGIGLGGVGSSIAVGGNSLGLGGSSIVLDAPSLISASTLAGIPGYNIVSSGPLAVTTISPIGPSGLAVASENYLEGVLSVSGQLPWLSAVAFEGAVPTSGSGVATCGCGNGQVGINSQSLGSAPAPLSGPLPNRGGLGLGGGNVYM